MKIEFKSAKKLLSTRSGLPCGVDFLCKVSRTEHDSFDEMERSHTFIGILNEVCKEQGIRLKWYREETVDHIAGDAHDDGNHPNADPSKARLTPREAALKAQLNYYQTQYKVMDIKLRNAQQALRNHGIPFIEANQSVFMADRDKPERVERKKQLMESRAEKIAKLASAEEREQKRFQEATRPKEQKQ